MVKKDGTARKRSFVEGVFCFIGEEYETINR